MIEKARILPADALVLDLEDGVPLGEKVTARQVVKDSLPGLSLRGQKVFVRINSLSSGLAEEDIEAIAFPGLEGISFPKPATGEDIEKVDMLLRAAEEARGLELGKIKIIPWVETAQGLINAFQIASTSPRVVGIAFGADDYATDLGIVRSEEGIEFFYPRSVIAVASTAAGVAALDTPYVNYKDEEGLVKDTKLARQLGFKGKFVVHPCQVEIVNRLFTPSQEEIAYARKIMEGFEAAVSRGSAVTSVEGKMVDTPVAERARRLLSLAEAIARKEAAR